MLNIQEEFERELKISWDEACAGLQYYYTFLGIHATLNAQTELLQRVNQTPLFWRTVNGALASSMYIALGRRFDQRSAHNIDKLVKIAQDNLTLFSKDALAARKLKQSKNAGEWLEVYMQTVYEPGLKDFRAMRRFVGKHRKIYEERYRDIRDKTVAHLELTEQTDIQILFSNTRIDELGILFGAMMSVHDALWELYYNGRKSTCTVLLPSVEDVLKNNKPTGITPKLPEAIILEAQAVIRSIGQAFEQVE